MFTLQILDDGKSFQRPLDGATTTVGSGAAATIVLRAAGVAAEHARFEAVGDGLRLVALAPLKVNGKAVDAGDLAVGDRIEIGGSYLVLGRAVAAPSDADADAPRPAPGVAPRPRRAAAPAPRRNVLALVAVGVAGVALAAMALFGGDPQQGLRDQVAVARRLRETAKLDDATAKLDQLAQAWAGATDGRLDLVQSERDAIAAAAAAADELRRQVADPADPRSYKQWVEELLQLEQSGRPDQRIGARIVRGNLRATYALKPRPGNAPAEPDAAAPAAAPATIEATRKTDIGEAAKLAGQGLFAPALALLQASLGEQDDAAAVRAVEAQIADVRGRARTAMDAALAEARDQARVDPRQAATALHALRHRFPGTGEFAAIDERIRAYEASAAEAAAGKAAAGATASPPSAAAAPAAAASETPAAPAATGLGSVQRLLEAVRVAETAGDFADAADRLRASADAVRARDAAFAGRLLARAEEAASCAALHVAVAAAFAGGGKVDAALAAGGKAQLQGVDGPRLVDGDGRKHTWHDLAPEGVTAIADQFKARGDAALGAAALLYRKSAPAAAEALLQRALKADPQRKDDVDRAVARGRGEPAPPGGYTLSKDGFTSAQSIALQKQAAQLRGRLEVALADRNPKARAELWAETMTAGPDAVSTLAAAMKKQLAQLAARFDRPTWRKDHDKLLVARQALDEARQHARELIYDEAKYFYPYKPPAVSPDRYAEYVRVQAEVNRRVAALRAVWGDQKLKLAVPGAIQSELERIDWLAARLAELGDGDDATLARIAWVRALPPGKTISVREISRSAEEQAEWEEWRRIDQYNAIVGRTLASPQREQLKVTNEYRAMFRHRPLAIVPVICAAAQGHAAEMSKLGYFAHQSPTPGRTTPFDRMRLAGYDKGASENIALVDGAQGAHDAWCQSSGHHRNLLDPNHHEVGIGADGRYWVQNFGAAQVYRESVAWDQSATAK